MNRIWSAEDAAFEMEVRAFLGKALTSRLRRAARLMTSIYAPYDVGMAWQKILHARGWAAPAWPIEFGGCGWSATRRYIFSRELAAAGAPPISPMGIGMCGPVLIGHGSPEQKARFLPPMLSGEEFWCQGYSEPGAGSDLASLRMNAREAGDDLVCNGQKIWTTHANHADWMFCLVRTAVEPVRQRGITFLLIDMASPGVRVKPIISLSGEHIQNEVFFDEVRVPMSQVVGRIGEGWTVAKYLMLFERGGGATAPGLQSRLSRLRAAIRLESAEGRLAEGEGRDLVRKVEAAAIQVEALEVLELRAMMAASQGGAPGPESSMMKTLSTELSQHLTELALELAGVYGPARQPHAVCAGGETPGCPAPADNFTAGPEQSWAAASRYLNDRAGSIYAGTNEIQRNIIAKTILGL